MKSYSNRVSQGFIISGKEEVSQGKQIAIICSDGFPLGVGYPYAIEVDNVTVCLNNKGAVAFINALMSLMIGVKIGVDSIVDGHISEDDDFLP